MYFNIFAIPGDVSSIIFQIIFSYKLSQIIFVTNKSYSYRYIASSSHVKLCVDPAGSDAFLNSTYQVSARRFINARN